ncbi:hypothetical protein Goklo_021257 [Gossypium klotzschianum]|uniref:Uncharacterized protein n=1 Tax=Gossypium klotzschianum TaxID=34286 RepID=A0A7J8UUK0_9ROSI|nr:hypothetical protein [Gossypium klotzschianum]
MCQVSNSCYKHSCHPHNLLQLGKSIIKGLSCDAYGRENCNDSLFSCRKCGFGVLPKSFGRDAFRSSKNGREF